MADTSKSAGKRVEDDHAFHHFPKGGDWRSRGFLTVPSPEDCAKLRLPIAIYPEDRDYIKKEFTENLQHLVTGQDGAPWTGYYTYYEGVKIALSSSFGVWFEIRKRDDGWEAFRVAREKLHLKHSALPGIDAPTLIRSGEPTNKEIVEEIRASRAASRASQHDAPPHQDPPQDPGWTTGNPDR